MVTYTQSVMNQYAVLCSFRCTSWSVNMHGMHKTDT